MLSLFYRQNPKTLLTTTTTITITIIIITIISTIKPSSQSSLPKTTEKQTIKIQVGECLRNERKVCCYDNDIPVWRSCPESNSQSTPQSPYTCQYIRDNNRSEAAFYNEDVESDRRIHQPSHPQNLKMDAVLSNKSAALWNISWDFPEKIKGLRAFLLEVVSWEGRMERGMDTWVYRVFNSSLNLRIFHYCTRLYPMDNYRVIVYSLPGKKETSITKTLVDNRYNLATNSCADRWKALIRTSQLNDITQVCFFTAPRSYNFTLYEVLIKEVNQTSYLPRRDLNVDNVEEAAEKVFCQEYKLKPASYTVLLVAKINENNECLCRGGCNYDLVFTVTKQKEVINSNTSLIPNLNSTPIPNSKLNSKSTPIPNSNNDIVVIATAVVVVVVVILTVVSTIVLCICYGAMNNLLNRLFTRDYAVIVVDPGTEEDLQKKILDLTEKINSKSRISVKSVVFKSAKTDPQTGIFKRMKSRFLGFITNRNNGEFKPTYTMKGNNKKVVEKVVGLISKAEMLLLVHSKKSREDFESFLKSGVREDVFSKITYLYGEKNMLEMNNHRMDKEVLHKDDGGDTQKEPQTLPRRCHIGVEGRFFTDVVGHQYHESVFQLPQNTEELLEWIRKAPEVPRVDWVPPEKSTSIDVSIINIRIKQLNKEFDSFASKNDDGAYIDKRKDAGNESNGSSNNTYVNSNSILSLNSTIGSSIETIPTKPSLTTTPTTTTPTTTTPTTTTPSTITTFKFYENSV